MTITPDAPTMAPLTFLELEITGRCQLSCPSLCYAQSGPTKGHGTMTTDAWMSLITEAAALGVLTVQFIGGEPTLHPDFTTLVAHALDQGLYVRVYSNLYRVREKWWELFGHPRVSLATSYHSDDPAEHDAITGRTGSHERTRANIIEAVGRNIPLKVGIIHQRDGQRSAQARTELFSLGVTQVSIDRLRGVGNGAQHALPSTSELCGRCGDGKAAVLPDGQVVPCGLGRFLPAGSISEAGLRGVLSSRAWADIAASIPRTPTSCVPDSCTPKEDSCQPSPGAAGCSPDDSACQPGQPACLPKFP